MSNKIAILIGATGATGTELLSQILVDHYFSKVIVFTRSALAIQDQKIQVHIVDFDNTSSWAHLVKGDVLFSTLGTTLKVAKTKTNQFKIDYTYQFQVAKAASNNGVNSYVLVSAFGANERSNFFYPRTKGQLDVDVQKLSFKNIHIFRPGILHRQSNKLRTVEKISIIIINALNKIGVLNKHKPMPVKVLAEKMILVAKNYGSPNIQIHNLNAIFSI
ncbi:MAG: NAD(P)H-binding protein [Sediminibacterium sp.]